MSNPWTPFYWRDYIGDTGHLTLMEHGAYLLLMAHYYMTGEPLPANAEQLHRICRAFADAERAACQSVLDQFFERDGDVYRNQRADEEIEKARKISEVRSNAARSRHSGSHANAGANAHAIAEQMHTQPQPQPQSHTETPKDQKQARATLALPDWLPAEQWQAFVEMRKRMKAVLTDRAVMLAIGELEKLRAQGHDPAAVLDQSIANGWKGLFPIKGKAGSIRAAPAGYLSETHDDLLQALQRQSGEVQ